MLINLDVRKVYLHGMKLQTLLVQLILPLCLTYPRGHRSVLFKTCAFPCHLIYLHKYFIIFYCCLQYLRICSKIRTYLFQTSMISRLTLLNILLQDHYQRLSIIETNESHKDVFRHVGSVVLRYLFSLLACLMSPPPPPYPFRFHVFFLFPQFLRIREYVRYVSPVGLSSFIMTASSCHFPINGILWMLSKTSLCFQVSFYSLSIH